MLSSLLTSGKNIKNSISKIFEKQIEVVDQNIEQEEENNEVNEINNQNNQKNESDEQRALRTLFIGNLNIKAKKNDVRKLFNQYGEIEKVWFRSIPVDLSTKKDKVKLPIRAAVLMGKISEGAQSQNCYVLFKNQKSAKTATQQDGQIFMGFHLRCSLEGQKKKDHIKTAFIGNLPFNVEEEEVRSVFEEAFGSINYVRLIRDPKTHNGKGFGYVCFNEFQSLKKAIEAETIQIKDRDVRIKKAAQTTKRDVQEQKNINNAKNAFTRISHKKRQGNVLKPKNYKRNNNNRSDKQIERAQIHKKIIKMKKRKINSKTIKEQVQDIKDQRRKNTKDTNIFNQY